MIEFAAGPRGEFDVIKRPVGARAACVVNDHGVSLAHRIDGEGESVCRGGGSTILG